MTATLSALTLRGMVWKEDRELPDTRRRLIVARLRWWWARRHSRTVPAPQPHCLGEEISLSRMLNVSVLV